MKKLGILLSVLVMVFGLVFSAQAALVDMNDGTIYDTDTQLSWLKNANTVGAMTWSNAMAWAATLNNGGGFAGLTGWRLPATSQPDASCGYQYDPGGGFPLQGMHFNCTNSEMGHLYYTELGNVAGGPLTNTGPFTDLQAYYYWSGTEYAPVPTYAWTFLCNLGIQHNGANKGDAYCVAWAVRPGARSTSATTTPVPASGTMGLIIMGVVGLMLMYGRRKKNMTA